MSLILQDITVRLSGKEIVRSASVKAEDQKITGIIGPNGSGKSTLLKTVFGLIPTQSGTIWINGTESTRLSKKSIARTVGYMGQETGTSFDFSVREIVSMGRFPYQGQKKQRKNDDVVQDALELLGIESLADRSILTLSGGEKKLVYLARTIAQEVSTIILDEPTNHLDICHQLFILDFLKQTDKTILLVLHDLTLAARYCDTVYLLQQGKTIDHGKPQEVLTHENVKTVFDVSGQVVKNKSNHYQFELL